MKIGKVVGHVVATVKHPDLSGLKILLVQPIGHGGSPEGAPIMALDHVDAGWGETVLLVDEGGSAGIALGLKDPPIRTVVVGVVDGWEAR